MNNKVMHRAETYRKTRKKQKWLYRALSVAAAGVVFCTTYALILPAITMEGESAHIHGADCYAYSEVVDVFACPYGDHAHEEICYDSNGETLCGWDGCVLHVHDETCPDDCAEAEFVYHVHDELCWQEDTLVCTLPEILPEEHRHTEECYAAGEPVCGLEEGGHTHDESCMGEISRELTCTTEEYEGHTHGDACYITEITSEPLCMLDHAHEDTCFIAGHILDCDIPESEGHSHGDECYTVEMGVVCEIPEEGHTHTEECYDRKQLCGVEIEAEMHRHTEDCFAQITVTYSEPVLICELEEADKWELAVPTELSGVYAQDLLAVAESQIGYEQDEEDVLVDATTGAVSYASRYGLWYGQPYEEWNTLFVMYCLEKAGIGEDVMPVDPDVENWVDTLVSAEKFGYPLEYVPKAGDLVFTENDNGLCVSIVTSVDSESGWLCVIEGDAEGSVISTEYAVEDVYGYGILGSSMEETEEDGIIEDFECESDGMTLFASGEGPSAEIPLVMNKYVRYNGGQNYTITLEAYATGEKKSVPTDIVFIIDQSCSMYSPVEPEAPMPAPDKMTTSADSVMTYNQLITMNMDAPENQKSALEGYYVAMFSNNGEYCVVPLRYSDNGWQRVIVTDASNANSSKWVYKTISGLWDNGNNTPDWVGISDSNGTWPQDFENKITIYKSVYGGAYDAMEAFVNEVNGKVQNCRAAIVGFSCPPDYGSGPMNTGIFVNGMQDMSSDFLGAVDDDFTDHEIDIYLNQAFVDMSTEDGIESFRASLNAIRTSGQTTTTQAGFRITNNLLTYRNTYDSGAAKANTYVILFTDGKPENKLSGTYNHTVAIEEANETKKLANVYSYGYNKVNEDFIMALSSAYPNAKNIGNDTSVNVELGKAVVDNPEQYYGMTDDSSKLVKIFRNLANVIVESTIELNKDTILQDVITPQFKFPDGADSANIILYTAPWNKSSFGEKTRLETAKIEINDKTIQIKGFEFNEQENWVVEGMTQGNKLIVEIPVTIDSKGGEFLPTNTSESKLDKIMFSIPHVDIPTTVLVKKEISGNRPSDSPEFSFTANYTAHQTDDMGDLRYKNNPKEDVYKEPNKLSCDGNYLEAETISGVAEDALLKSGGEPWSIKNVHVGTEITISEENIPAGYILQDIQVTIDGEPLTEQELEELNGEIDNDSITILVKPGMEITFVNHAGTELPQTGGPGITKLYMFSALLIAGAAGGLIYKTRRRQRG